MMIFQSMRQEYLEKNIWVLPTGGGTCDLPVTSPDAQPLNDI